MIDPITRLRCTLGHWKIVADALDETERMRAAFLGYLQTENKCARTGQPCRAEGKCGCALEMQEYASAVEQGVDK